MINIRIPSIKYLSLNITRKLFLLHFILIQYAYCAFLPSCRIKNSICTLTDKSLLKQSTYCISSTTIYVGVDDTGKCVEDEKYMKNPGNYFFNSDYKLMRSANVIEAGYICSGMKATECEAMENGIYINSISSTSNFVIDYDATNTAVASKNIFIGQQTKYFFNSGVERESKEDSEAHPLIKCDSKKCEVIPFKNINKGFYINSGDVTKKSIIECDKTDCYLISSPKFGYYANADIEDNQRPLLLCSESQGTCDFQTLDSIDPGYYINEGSEEKNSIIRCDDKSCNVLTLSENLSQGYYINAGDSSAPIITCNQSTCSAGPDRGTKLKGSYQFINNSLKFRYADNDTIGCDSDDDSESLYFVVALGAGKFPGLVSDAQTLFKISKSSISQVVIDGYLPVGKSDLKLKHENLVVDQNIDLYHCSKSTELCILLSSCEDGRFLLDSQSQRAFYCSNNKLTDISNNSGYYVNSGRVEKSLTPYLITCNHGVCKDLNNPLNYYRNAGIEFEPSLSPLVYCSSSNCSEVKATTGYYISSDTPGDEKTNRGVIYCQESSSECMDIKSNFITKYYINEGVDKNNKGLIRCTNYQCNSINANSGYYFSDNSSQLIYCTNSSNCKMADAVDGYYFLADISNQQDIIKCSSSTDKITCEIQKASQGFYISAHKGILIDCLSKTGQCFTILAVDGIYRSATTSYTSYSRYVDVNERSSMKHNDKVLKETSSFVNSVQRANNNMVYNIIVCQSGQCNELSASELYDIPYCIFTNNKCFISNDPLINGEKVKHVATGDYCTNSDRSIFYFATDTIDLEVDTIDVTLSTYTFTTTTTNCVIVSNKYAKNYFTVGNQIIRINEGKITKMTETGYYFINIDKNVLINSAQDESLYNEESIKLFKCDGQRCFVVDKPSDVAYYADINKHIIKYNPETDKYSFPYEKDIICIYDNNRCTPKYDLHSNELCITYKGELALVFQKIIGYETGPCFKSPSIVSPIYGISQYFYEMNANYARRITTSGYYFTDRSTHGPINVKTLSKSWSSSLYLYGCIDHKCKLEVPEENSYYYDQISQQVLKYENSVWHIVETQGYSFIKITPNFSHIHTISKSVNNISIEMVSENGYYHTIDNNMYDCKYSKDINNILCSAISNNDYYYTIDQKLYYCIYDSENIERTVCNQQLCFPGQLYYFNKFYYRCAGKNSIYEPVAASTCRNLDTVVINYPTFLEKEYPSRVQLMLEYMYEVNIDDIETHYNSSYIPSITGIFDQCQYDENNNISTFNLVCLKNFVALSSVNPPKICSIRRMGFVECVEDEEHPGRCHPDGAWSYLYDIKTKFLLMFIILLSTIYILYVSI
ncbi:hypothetical protein PIROE2DRAFT_9622 [Piromyces sp. E2]|nr:hypothetical protein PIROE2DRAFT_9622 [Piromyces sp. E2]|eukprot:OUM63760.1 hypothetical protein PIROE2DRAFT_9622 [Piromyces sp. E2]